MEKKRIKPGQIYVHNGSFLRAKKKIDGCTGCVLNNLLLCPNLKGMNGPDCEENNIVFVKF